MSPRKDGMSARIKEHEKAISSGKNSDNKLFYHLLPVASTVRAIALLETEWLDDRAILYFAEAV